MNFIVASEKLNILQVFASGCEAYKAAYKHARFWPNANIYVNHKGLTEVFRLSTGNNSVSKVDSFNTPKKYVDKYSNFDASKAAPKLQSWLILDVHFDCMYKFDTRKLAKEKIKKLAIEYKGRKFYIANLISVSKYEPSVVTKLLKDI